MSFFFNFMSKSRYGNTAAACLLLLAPCAGSPQGVEKNIPSKKIGSPAATSNKYKRPIVIAKTKPTGSLPPRSSHTGQTKIKGSEETPQPSKAISSMARPSVETPQISYFNQDGRGWLRAGQMVHITMHGTVGAQATFRVVGLSESLAMLENSPGQYIANWTVPDGKALPGMKALVIGDLTLSNSQSNSLLSKKAPTIQASLPLCVDTVAPVIQNMMPANQTTLTTASPTVSADYKDEGSGIDISSVRLILNGRDLTGEASITTERLVYKPFVPLMSGDQSVEIIVGDNAGNVIHQTWHFTVASK